MVIEAKFGRNDHSSIMQLRLEKKWNYLIPELALKPDPIWQKKNYHKKIVKYKKSFMLN
jgi:hypothetical protein